MNFPEVYSATGMMELIQKIGFLPLLDSGIEGFSAEDIVAEDCGYVRLPEGGWDWPLWKWKGEIVQEMPCMYGKFFNKKANTKSGNDDVFNSGISRPPALLNFPITFYLHNF